MKFTINHITLSIPPFVSVRWNQVEYLRMQEGTLIIGIWGSTPVEIPPGTLEENRLQQLFACHAEVGCIEEEQVEEESPSFGLFLDDLWHHFVTRSTFVQVLLLFFCWLLPVPFFMSCVFLWLYKPKVLRKRARCVCESQRSRKFREQRS